MNDDIKNSLIEDAKKYDDYNIWVGDVGYQDWMSEYCADPDSISESENLKIDKLLRIIFEQAQILKISQVRYEIRNAIGKAESPAPAGFEWTDYFVNYLTFYADDDESAIEHVERLQRLHDDRVPEEVKNDSDSWDRSPCYVDCLYRGEAKLEI